MMLTNVVKNILSHYESDNPGSKNNLARILMHGQLRGTGKMLILPVDQGIEHGPARSFLPNPDAFEPHYFFELAIKAQLNAYAAPLGLLECGADTYAGSVPTILKLNSSYSLATQKDQWFTSSVQDALRLGCVGVGLTIYPASEAFGNMLEETKEIVKEARSYGLVVVIWAYPRGPQLSPDDETSLDVIAYGAHIACQLGAHIVKVKPPKLYFSQKETQNVLAASSTKINNLSDAVQHVKLSCFNRKRLILFSGGTAKHENDVLNEIKLLKQGGADGSIVGRNAFQRPFDESVHLLNSIANIYLN